MSKFQSHNYIQIQGWMITDLELSGNQLIIYAIIFGFSQKTDQAYSGSINYLSSALNCSRSTVINSLKALVKNGYLLKKDTFKNNVKFCEYDIDIEVIKKNTREVQKVNGGSTDSKPGGGVNFTPNNTTLNNTKKETPAQKNQPKQTDTDNTDWENKAKDRSQDLKDPKNTPKRAFEVLKNDYPMAYEQRFLMNYGNALKGLKNDEKKNLVERFNNKCDLEDWEWTGVKIAARLCNFTDTWLRNNKKNKNQDGSDQTSKIPIG